MLEPIPISSLNDFLFCPYSIYLHQVYHGTEEETVKAIPQLSGTVAHERIAAISSGTAVRNMPVASEELGIFGVIDEYITEKGELREYKNNLPEIYAGQILQLECQSLCLMEMGYPIEEMALCCISDGKASPVPVPDSARIEQIKDLIRKFRDYDPADETQINPAKCRKCIYCGLCEKSDMSNDF